MYSSRLGTKHVFEFGSIVVEAATDIAPGVRVVFDGSLDRVRIACPTEEFHGVINPFQGVPVKAGANVLVFLRPSITKLQPRTFDIDLTALEKRMPPLEG